jgi:hypothetical protein
MFNTVTPDKLVLKEDGFVWKGAPYRFSEVASVRFKWVRTQKKRNFINVCAYDDFYLTVFFSNGKSVDMEVGSSMWEATLGDTTKSEQRIGNFKEFLNYLLASTKAQRAQKYLTQIQQSNSFEYGGATFFLDGRVKGKNGAVRIIKQSEILKYAYAISFREKSVSGTTKVKRWLIGHGGDVEVSASVDQDIFYALLAKFYGLTWK